MENLKIKKDDVIEMIHHWSDTFGLPVNKKEGFPSQDRIDLSLKLIDEELQETKDAIIAKDFKETKDGLGDLLWVTVRAMMELGINPVETIEKIYESNMSKADVSMEEALITYKKYMEQGIKTYSKEKNGLFITIRASDHKILTAG